MDLIFAALISALLVTNGGWILRYIKDRREGSQGERRFQSDEYERLIAAKDKESEKALAERDRQLSHERKHRLRLQEKFDKLEEHAEKVQIAFNEHVTELALARYQLQEWEDSEK